MKNRKKGILYSILLIISIIIFTLAVVLDASGVFGFLITVFSIYLFIGCIIKLCKLNPKFKDNFLNFIDILFWLP